MTAYSREYKDPKMKVKGHSTRAIGSSWELFNGAFANSILNAVNWSPESTITKFYLRDVNATMLNLKKCFNCK